MLTFPASGDGLEDVTLTFSVPIVVVISAMTADATCSVEEMTKDKDKEKEEIVVTSSIPLFASMQLQDCFHPW